MLDILQTDSRGSGYSSKQPLKIKINQKNSNGSRRNCRSEMGRTEPSLHAIKKKIHFILYEVFEKVNYFFQRESRQQ